MRNTRLVILLALSTLITACSTPAQRIDRLASSSGMHRSEVHGTAFDHVVYMKQSAIPDARLFVFIEGDGVPWDRGIRPSDDPTTGNPLALKLMIETPYRSAYVSRPCYQSLRSERCSNEVWTSQRYSLDVVTSMNAAIKAIATGVSAHDIVLVGYSGGGPLAVLIAERNSDVSTVVTVAANLDVAAWAQHHGYLPLEGSLDPAASTLPHAWREVHFGGENDQVVPLETRQRYFNRYADAVEIREPQYDHVCCWATSWPELLNRALQTN